MISLFLIVAANYDEGKKLLNDSSYDQKLHCRQVAVDDDPVDIAVAVAVDVDVDAVLDVAGVDNAFRGNVDDIVEAGDYDDADKKMRTRRRANWLAKGSKIYSKMRNEKTKTLRTKRQSPFSFLVDDLLGGDVINGDEMR